MIHGVDVLPMFFPQTLQFQNRECLRYLKGFAEDLGHFLRNGSPLAFRTSLELSVEPVG